VMITTLLLESVYVRYIRVVCKRSVVDSARM
jgi:hypothetical protein